MKRVLLIAILTLVPPSIFVSVDAVGAGGGKDRKVLPPPKGNFSVAEAQRFSNFPLYYAGDTAASLPLVAVHRVEGGPDYPEDVRPDHVTFLYGLCTAVQDDGCMPPLQIQIWNACERYQALYPFGPDESLTVRGIPASFYEGKTRLELYSGAVTIVLFGRDGDQLLHVARKLRGVNKPIAEVDGLPTPEQGVREGGLVCQRS